MNRYAMPDVLSHALTSRHSSSADLFLWGGYPSYCTLVFLLRVLYLFDSRAVQQYYWKHNSIVCLPFHKRYHVQYPTLQ